MSAVAQTRQDLTVGIVGAGSIGSAFAIVFAAAGHRVIVQDPDPASLEKAKARVATSLDQLHAFNLLDESQATLTDRIQYAEDLRQTVSDADFIQECAPEKAELKQPLFSEIERHARPEAIIASSASAIPASRSMGHLTSRHRCLVCHPGNPPYLIPVIEIVPAPFTDPDVTERARQFFAAANMSPIVVRKELEGFVFNRLQGAMLREAYCLFRDGVATIEEIDSIVRDGLGMRWSFMGPFETVDLNTQGGLASHALKMGPAYARMGKERGQDDPWTPDLVARATAERRAALPLDDWQQRTEWRDRQLMALLAHRRRLDADQDTNSIAGQAVNRDFRR